MANFYVYVNYKVIYTSDSLDCAEASYETALRYAKKTDDIMLCNWWGMALKHRESSIII